MSRSDALRRIDAAISRAMATMPPDPNLAQWMREYEVNHRHRLAEDLVLLDQHVPPTAQIVEFGSAPLFLTLAVRELGYKIIGLDIIPETFARTIAENGLDIRKVNFETEPLPLPDDSVDVAIFNEVFEHLRVDLIATMSKVRRVLKPGGLLFLSTPNMRSLTGIWALLWHGYGGHTRPDLFWQWGLLQRYGFMGHVREYTPREVSEFLEKLGFRIRRVVFRSYGPHPPGQPLMQIRDFIESAVCKVLPSLQSCFSLICERVG